MPLQGVGTVSCSSSTHTWSAASENGRGEILFRSLSCTISSCNSCIYPHMFVISSCQKTQIKRSAGIALWGIQKLCVRLESRKSAGQTSGLCGSCFTIVALEVTIEVSCSLRYGDIRPGCQSLWWLTVVHTSQKCGCMQLVWFLWQFEQKQHVGRCNRTASKFYFRDQESDLFQSPE